MAATVEYSSPFGFTTGKDHFIQFNLHVIPSYGKASTFTYFVVYIFVVKFDE